MNMHVQSHKYSVTVTHISKRPCKWPKMAGKIIEDKVWVGEFHRPTQQGRYIPPIAFKFYSQAARHRFENFADIISVEEAIEALLPDLNAPTIKKDHK